MQGPDGPRNSARSCVSVADQDSQQPILLDMRRCGYFSSMGYSALFKLVKQAKERQRQVKFCNMHPDVKVGADIVGLYHVVEIYDSRESALQAFAAGLSRLRSAGARAEPRLDTRGSLTDRDLARGSLPRLLPGSRMISSRSSFSPGTGEVLALLDRR